MRNFSCWESTICIRAYFNRVAYAINLSWIPGDFISEDENRIRVKMMQSSVGRKGGWGWTKLGTSRVPAKSWSSTGKVTTYAEPFVSWQWPTCLLCETVFCSYTTTSALSMVKHYSACRWCFLTDGSFANEASSRGSLLSSLRVQSLTNNISAREKSHASLSYSYILIVYLYCYLACYIIYYNWY